MLEFVPGDTALNRREKQKNVLSYVNAAREGSSMAPIEVDFGRLPSPQTPKSDRVWTPALGPVSGVFW